MILEQTIHEQTYAVLCALRAGGVVGPFLFLIRKDRATTVNGNGNFLKELLNICCDMNFNKWTQLAAILNKMEH